jgi:NADPH:quinone reductase-like Zn-dependent oxidoreductase
LGADLVIDYKTQAFSTIIKDYDAVLVTAANALADSYAVLRKGGILVSLAGTIDENAAKESQVKAIGQMSQANAKQLERLAALIDAGNIKPLIDKTFNLSAIKEAFTYFEQGHPKGKVVVNISLPTA